MTLGTDVSSHLRPCPDCNGEELSCTTCKGARLFMAYGDWDKLNRPNNDVTIEDYCSLEITGIVPAQVLADNAFYSSNGYNAHIYVGSDQGWTRVRAFDVMTHETVGIVDGQVTLVGVTELDWVVGEATSYMAESLFEELLELWHVCDSVGAKLDGRVEFREFGSDLLTRVDAGEFGVESTIQVAAWPEDLKPERAHTRDARHA